MNSREDVKGLRILARRDALTESDWFDLLEKRRSLLELYLRWMTIKSLGDLMIVRDEMHHARKLSVGAMVELSNGAVAYRRYRVPGKLKSVEGDFSLDTRGIFPDDEVYHHGHFTTTNLFDGYKLPASGRLTRFWGLTRKGQWIKVECVENFFKQDRVPEYDKRQVQCSEVVRLTVSESTPQEICEFCRLTPRWIWSRLGDVVEKWVEDRMSLLEDAEELASVIKAEKMLLDIIE